MDLDNVTARDKSIQFSKMIPNCFPCLSTLPTSLPNFIELRYNALECSKIVTEGLKVVDAGFRNILSGLQKAQGAL
jgi:hypothetical protein